MKVNSLLVLIFFLVGFILNYVFTSRAKETEPKLLPNLVIVNNTDKCTNKCTHIHHWVWQGLLIIMIASINYCLGFPWTYKYVYLISIYIGLFFGSLFKFGSDIFVFEVDCQKC